MSFHLLAYGSASLDATAGNVQLPAIADQQYTISNSNFQIPVPHQLIGARLGGANLTRGRITAGSLRNKGLPQLWPFDTAVLPATNGNIIDFRDFPLSMRAEEDIRVDVTNSAAGATNAVLMVTPILNNTLMVPRMDIRPLRFTAAVTAAAYAWGTNTAIVLEDTVEAGTYSIYGLEVQGAAVLAARLILPGQFLRPGCIGKAALGGVAPNMFRGELGLWGNFNTYALPMIESLETGAGASTLTGVIWVGKA